uniref:hypothetical protein n=1 Tax=Thaumasiovibrio occultus TaxID=1891184 RepID=UPI000B34B29A|nr:hypothetical protein [Thaumasiovibrio occultus]
MKASYIASVLLALFSLPAVSQSVRPAVYAVLTQADNALRQEQPQKALDVLATVQGDSEHEVANIERLRGMSFAALGDFDKATASCQLAVSLNVFEGESAVNLAESCANWHSQTLHNTTASNTTQLALPLEGLNNTAATPAAAATGVALVNSVATLNATATVKDASRVTAASSADLTEYERRAKNYADRGQHSQANYWFHQGVSDGQISLNERTLFTWLGYATKSEDWQVVDYIYTVLRQENDSLDLMEQHMGVMGLTKNWTRLLSVAQAGTEQYPYHADMWRQLGISHFYLGHYSEAEEAFAMLENLMPSSDAATWLVKVRQQG